jgi:iron complex transport system ATP-binding protein
VPLIASDLSFSYHAAQPVLRHVSLSLNPGSITAILGPNGAGKSTLLRLMLGLLRPTHGSIALDEEPVSSISHARRAARLVYIPQRASIAFAFTLRQYVRMGLGQSLRRDSHAVVDRALDRVELLARAEEPLPTLSVGQQQRATLARALVQVERAAPPAFILADEPTSAMDPRHAILASGILSDLSRAGHAIALVAHDLALATRLASHAIVLDSVGRVAAFAPASEAITPGVLDPVFAVRFSPEPCLLPTRP